MHIIIFKKKIIFFHTILIDACSSGNTKLVKYILSLEEFKMDDNNGALYVACNSGNYTLVKFLMSLNKFDIKHKYILNPKKNNL